MATITPEDVRAIAALAKLEFDDQSLDSMTQDMRKILDYIEVLDEAAMASSEADAPIERSYRPDEPKPGIDIELVQNTAPSVSGRTFKVPRVLGDKA